MLQVGDRIPELQLNDDSGRVTSTTSFLGRPLVLYFYPKDDTPGCTSEAGQFRDEYASFEEKGVAVIGVSRDTVESHRKFKAKYELPFPLLADVDGKLYKACGVEKRSTFLFDEKGVVKRVWPKVTVEGHTADVMTAVTELLATTK